MERQCWVRYGIVARFGSAMFGKARKGVAWPVTVRHSSEVGQGKVVQGGVRFGMVGRGEVRHSS